MQIDKFWFRIAAKLLGPEHKDANRHNLAIALNDTKVLHFDVFASDPKAAQIKFIDTLGKDANFSQSSHVKIQSIKALQCELSLDQMAMTVVYYQNKQVQTEQGQMERLPSGLLVPNVVH